MSSENNTAGMTEAPVVEAGFDGERSAAQGATSTGQEEASEAAFRALAAPFVAPISADAPAGIDARYEKGYEAIRNEIAKQGLASEDAVDWKLVVNEGEKLLKERSKDLLVAAYLAWGWYRRDRWRGLAAGISVMTELIDRYWDTLFPTVRRNARARANAVTWLAEKGETITEVQLTADDRSSIELLEIGVKKLRQLGYDRFDDDSIPSIGPLLELVGRLQAAIPEAPPPKTQPALNGKVPAASEGASSEGIDARPREIKDSPAVELPKLAQAPTAVGEADLDAFISELKESLRAVSVAIRAARPSDAIAFRFAQLAMYLGIVGAPDTEGSTKTIAPAPPLDAMNYLQQLYDESKWLELLAEAEDLLGRFVFSLDCLRFACLALEHLGPEYQKAYVVCMGELSALLWRVPELKTLQYSNGTAFASAITRQWLDSQLGGQNQGDVRGDETGMSGVGKAPGDDIEVARQAAARGDIREATGVLQRAIASAPSGRRRFYLRVELAEMCMAANVPDVAHGVYAALLDEVRARDLERWEPELARRYFVGYYEALKSLSAENEGTAGNLSMIYQHLCQIDPQWAVGQRH
jgi:type VI secretion system protein VasJ